MKRLLWILVAALLLTGCSSPESTSPESDAVVIAMLDTGISTTAIASSCLREGYNYVTDSGDTEDRINHGTATASIIAGCASAKVTGLAPDALLIPLVVADKVNREVISVFPPGACPGDPGRSGCLRRKYHQCKPGYSKR